MTSKKLNSLPGAPRVLPPPAADDTAKRALNSYGTMRDEHGRVSRSTGRDVQFATIVTPDFKDWIKSEAKRRGKRMCVLLEDMRVAYEKQHNSGSR
jgi:hypothetical protein